MKHLNYRTYTAHPCFMALANLSTGNVFNTSSGVSHARLACSTRPTVVTDDQIR